MSQLQLCLIGTLLLTFGPHASAQPPSGPAAEKRFPPLKLPAGFKATLYACDPFIEYPSVIALGPKPGSLLVAVDYMTGLGTEIVRRDEIRVLEDTDGDGYADKSTVFASGLNSIQGLAYHHDAVLVMHSPLLTRLRDRDGDGKADERTDLLEGLGLPPEKNPVRLHGANGVCGGHDGWLYLALGDHGADVQRPEGDRLVLRGGGILRCRPDGRDLHVFSTGLRNIYDVALDDELNVFVRDNENDGGDYKIRVYHSFFGADHGYPYLYWERPSETLAPLADLGLGSSAGGVSYQETQFPKEYRGNLFFCEWGRAVVRYVPVRAGSGFGRLKEVEFAVGADNDPYGFKPTDLVVGHDGSLFVSDWADGQRPKRGRGRIYQVRFSPGNSSPSSLPLSPGGERGLQRWLEQLDSPSCYDRCEAQRRLEERGLESLSALKQARLETHGRLHAVWILAHLRGDAGIDDLFETARKDADARVQAQAIRAIADLADPVLTRHRLDAGPGDSRVAERLATLAPGRDPRVQLEIVVALARLRWQGGPTWARSVISQPDGTLLHAVQQMLRHSGNWPEVLKLLDELHGSPLRAIALRALAEQPIPEVVTELIDRLAREPSANQRLAYADLLTRVHRLPGAQPYWGYRPAPRPANTLVWIGTAAIEEALDRTLADPDREVRVSLLRRMQREQVPAKAATLNAWLLQERRAEYVSAILESLRRLPAGEVRAVLENVVLERRRSVAQRREALDSWASGLDTTSEERLISVAESLEDGPVLAALLRYSLQRPRLRLEAVLARKTHSPDGDVRAAAMEAWAERPGAEAAAASMRLLADTDIRVRQAAAAAAGKLKLAAAANRLLELARDADPGVRRAALEALRRLHEPRALSLALAALEDRATQLAALACVGELGGPAQTPAVLRLAKHNPAGDILAGSMRVLAQWAERDGVDATPRQNLARAVAEIQGTQGVLLRWHTLGPIRSEGVAPLVEQYGSPAGSTVLVAAPPGWRTLPVSGTDTLIRLGQTREGERELACLGLTECLVPEETAVQFRALGSGSRKVWLNGRSLDLTPDADRFSAVLRKGVNRIIVQVSGVTGAVSLQLSFRRRIANADQERFAQAALTRTGDAERGRAVFLNVEKSLCLKCHRLGEQGEQIGPELTGLGSRFSRIHIIESILEPSRTIAPSFQALRVVLKNGRTITGLKLEETETTLTLADQQGEKQVLAKADVEEQQPTSLSLMPEGLEKRLTADEFVDLIAFLSRQREGGGR